MRPLFASILLVFLLASCAPVFPPATATPTLTPTRTPTPTPTLTPTATVTPTPSLPAEIAARLQGRDWRIENGQVKVGDVVWYEQDAEGEWQPALFVADFDKYQFSLNGLEIVDENGVVRIFDPNAKEGKQMVYEDGRFGLRFAVENLTDLMPTPYKPYDNPYGLMRPPDEVYTVYFPSISLKRKAAFQEKYDLEIDGLRIITTGEEYNSWPILLDPEKFAYGLVMKRNRHDPGSAVWLFAEKADGSIIIIPLFNEITKVDVYTFWNDYEK